MPYTPDADLPNWPSLMDVRTAAAYLGIGEASFRGVVARAGIQPVDLGLSLLRWRRSDLDHLIEQLPPKELVGDPTKPEMDPAGAALERVRRRHGKPHETR
jgi:hypothetical protein